MTFQVPDKQADAEWAFWCACHPETVMDDMPMSKPMTDEHVEKIRLLLERYPQFVHLRDEHRATPLHYTVEHQNLGGTQLLLRYGADVDAINPSGDTPLHKTASSEGCPSRIGQCRLLLDHGANPNIQNRRGNTPLHEAVTNWNEPATRLLLRRGADPNLTCEMGDAFHCDIVEDDTDADTPQPHNEGKLKTWMEQWKKEIAQFAQCFVAAKPSRGQCFSARGNGKQLDDLVLDACVTGQFATLIALPLIESPAGEDRKLFQEIWSALPKQLQGQHQGLYMKFVKAGGVNPAIGPHTSAQAHSKSEDRGAAL